ncbi:MAG: energy transducer TonB [Deltaproteobacteria bacterium]|nr:energy transducer TonB [Deltaproteobacteria bacterium]
MIRLPVVERGFTLALIASAAIHAGLLPLLLSFASGSAPGHLQPIGEICISAFLVPRTPAAAGKTSALPDYKRQGVDRVVPVAASLPREVPENVPPAEKEGNPLLAERNATVTALLPRKAPEYVASAEIDDRKILAEIRPHAGLGKRDNAGGLPAPMVLIPRGGDRSGSHGAGISSARQADGEFSGVDGAGVPADRREGPRETDKAWGGAWPPKDADAVPRYGDNARPVYPPLARLRGYQGLVVLFVEVLADGRVGQVGIRHSAGHEVLDRSALEAVRSWRFEPGRREGRTVTMSVEVPVRFVLSGNSAW